MGREVRMVPPDWKHPKNDDGGYQPMFDLSYAKEAKRWLEEARAWDDGTHPTLLSNPKYKQDHPYFWEWDGNPPDPKYFMPDWPAEQRTHFQMYEDTTEGTPISPVMASAEELARWLADTGASAFGGMTASYEQWLATIKRGSAPSMVLQVGCPVMSGVEALVSLTSCEPSKESNG